MTALHHEIAGPSDAPVLLLGGSLGTTLAMWDRQLPLAAHLRLVRFDHRGHGGSSVLCGPYELDDLGRDVAELMDHLEIARASYCGLSLGGMVGMWLAAEVPERIDRLVLLCTSAHMPPPSMWQERAQAVRQARAVEPLADAVLERWLTPAFAATHDPSTPPEHQRLIADAIPHARHETVAPGAHAVAVEQPEVVNRLVLEHLRADPGADEPS